MEIVVGIMSCIVLMQVVNLFMLNNRLRDVEDKSDATVNAIKMVDKSVDNLASAFKQYMR